MSLDVEALAGFRVPASWANRFSVVVQDDRVRIAFADYPPGATAETTRFHSAIVTGHADALALAEVIIATVSRQEDQVEKLRQRQDKNGPVA